MSSAGDDQLLGVERFQPGRLWSLQEMIEKNLGKLISAVNYIQTFSDLIQTNETKVMKIDDGVRTIYQEAFGRLAEALAGFDLKASDRQLQRISANIDKDSSTNFTRGDFKEYVEELLLRITDELELTKCLILESSRASFYEPKRPLFVETISKNYPSAYLEVEEAGKCLALGRSTACVFHLMRVMEVGIHATAKALKIDDPIKPAERSWGVIIRKLRETLDNRKRWRRGEKKFFGEVIANLDAIRNPWRNATMHVEQTYTEEEAENIYYAVRAFMTKLAQRYDETGRRFTAAD